jgi:hypothetical protein
MAADNIQVPEESPKKEIIQDILCLFTNEFICLLKFYVFRRIYDCLQEFIKTRRYHTRNISSELHNPTIANFRKSMAHSVLMFIFLVSFLACVGLPPL